MLGHQRFFTNGLYLYLYLRITAYFTVDSVFQLQRVILVFLAGISITSDLLLQIKCRGGGRERERFHIIWRDHTETSLSLLSPQLAATVTCTSKGFRMNYDIHIHVQKEYSIFCNAFDLTKFV